MHAKFTACKAQLSEPAVSSSSPDQQETATRVAIFNGSSLQRETVALRKDLDRKATALPLASQQPAADFLVCTGAKGFPHKLASAYPYSHLDGVWAQRPELVNGRPAYTCAYCGLRDRINNFSCPMGALPRLLFGTRQLRPALATVQGKRFPVGSLANRVDLVKGTRLMVQLTFSSTPIQHPSRNSSAGSAELGLPRARAVTRSAAVGGEQMCATGTAARSRFRFGSGRWRCRVTCACSSVRSETLRMASCARSRASSTSFRLVLCPAGFLSTAAPRTGVHANGAHKPPSRARSFSFVVTR